MTKPAQDSIPTIAIVSHNLQCKSYYPNDHQHLCRYEVHWGTGFWNVECIIHLANPPVLLFTFCEFHYSNGFLGSLQDIHLMICQYNLKYQLRVWIICEWIITKYPMNCMGYKHSCLDWLVTAFQQLDVPNSYELTENKFSLLLHWTWHKLGISFKPNVSYIRNICIWTMPNRVSCKKNCKGYLSPPLLCFAVNWYCLFTSYPSRLPHWYDYSNTSVANPKIWVNTCHEFVYQVLMI